MILVFKIRNAILVYRGAAILFTKEVEWIDEFRADGRCQGY